MAATFTWVVSQCDRVLADGGINNLFTGDVAQLKPQAAKIMQRGSLWHLRIDLRRK